MLAMIKNNLRSDPTVRSLWINSIKANYALRSKLIERGVWFERGVGFDRTASVDDVAALVAELKPKAIGKPLRRFGTDADGGYLMPDDLDGVSACISPGVSTQVGFDKEIADRGIDVHLADASVPGPPIQHERFHFTKKFLDTYNSETTITLDDYCSGIGGSDDLIIQMDIEGAEYRVLASTSDALLSRFRVLIIEFHDLDHLYAETGFREKSPIFRRLLRTHEVVHIHPNNYAVASIKAGGLDIPPVLEFTFYRKDRDRFETRELQFPHPLDKENSSANPPFVLPRCWQPS